MKAYTKLLASLVLLSGAYGAPGFANTRSCQTKRFER